MQKMVNEVQEKGAIWVDSAGNEGINVREPKCLEATEFSSVIGVGASSQFALDRTKLANLEPATEEIVFSPQV